MVLKIMLSRKYGRMITRPLNNLNSANGRKGCATQLVHPFMKMYLYFKQDLYFR